MITTTGKQYIRQLFKTTLRFWTLYATFFLSNLYFLSIFCLCFISFRLARVGQFLIRSSFQPTTTSKVNISTFGRQYSNQKLSNNNQIEPRTKDVRPGQTRIVKFYQNNVFEGFIVDRVDNQLYIDVNLQCVCDSPTDDDEIKYKIGTKVLMTKLFKNCSSSDIQFADSTELKPVGEKMDLFSKFFLRILSFCLYSSLAIVIILMSPDLLPWNIIGFLVLVVALSYQRLL